MKNRPTLRGSVVLGFLLGILVASLIAAVVVWRLRVGDSSQARIDLSRPTVVRQIHRLQRLETVVFGLDKIVAGGQESRYLPKFLVGDRLLLIVYGEVTAGVDLGRIEAKDVVVNGRPSGSRFPDPRSSRRVSTTNGRGSTRARRGCSREWIPTSSRRSEGRRSGRSVRPRSQTASWKSPPRMRAQPSPRFSAGSASRVRRSVNRPVRTTAHSPVLAGHRSLAARRSVGNLHLGPARGMAVEPPDVTWTDRS